MILADKIARLRKKNGWSQEELAQRMNVSRQAVSKWESAQTIPDLDKILQLGALFGVTTDYLLKDELEDEEFTAKDEPVLRRVSLAQADEFLRWRKKAAVRIAAATFACVVAAIPLLLLGAAAGAPDPAISGNVAAGAGLAALLALVTAAVAVFLHCGFRNAPYEFLDGPEPFETEYGVEGLVRERQRQFRPTYARCNVIAACVCILSPLPLLLAAFTGDELLAVAGLSATMVLAGAGAALFIVVGVRWASMQKLLQEGDFTPRKRRLGRSLEPIATAYWLCATAVYLAWSFLSENWEITWVVWPVAGVLFAAVMALCRLRLDRGENSEE